MGTLVGALAAAAGMSGSAVEKWFRPFCVDVLLPYLGQPATVDCVCEMLEAAVSMHASVDNLVTTAFEEAGGELRGHVLLARDGKFVRKILENMLKKLIVHREEEKEKDRKRRQESDRAEVAKRAKSNNAQRRFDTLSRVMPQRMVSKYAQLGKALNELKRRKPLFQGAKILLDGFRKKREDNSVEHRNFVGERGLAIFGLCPFCPPDKAKKTIVSFGTYQKSLKSRGVRIEQAGLTTFKRHLTKCLAAVEADAILACHTQGGDCEEEEEDDEEDDDEDEDEEAEEVEEVEEVHNHMEEPDEKDMNGDCESTFGDQMDKALNEAVGVS